ncbi:hypothetical protein E2562_014573 [Oryza meyeriana var. granulata]|uniref:Uncharacterized protein n=1 Tax=Oryza meyeriana var. granulata TaxID=110450 RepID=A0A6G1EK39_9ORYZ|nr:hypothetical protein E2562_014573 [Oryza meyeriana var. granulata]
MAAGASGELGVVVVGAGVGAKAPGNGAGAGAIGETKGTGDGAKLGVGVAVGAGDGGEDSGVGIGATGGGTAGGGVWRPLRSAMTTTMSFSPARQLASLPLMKKKGPDRSNVNTVLPSSNLPLANDADMLHASYAP